jgi:hypothetical protein
MSSAAIAGSIAPSVLFAPRLLGERSRDLAKYDHHHALERLRLVDGLDGDVELVCRIAVHAKAVHLDRRALLDGPPQRDGKLCSYGGTGHDMDIPVRLAGRRFEILSRVSADVEDVPEFVHQDGRRGELLQQQLIRQRLEVCGRGCLR